MNVPYDGIYSIIKSSVDSFVNPSGTAGVQVKFMSKDSFMIYFIMAFNERDSAVIKKKLDNYEATAKKVLRGVEAKVKKDIREVFGKSPNFTVEKEDFTNTKIATSYRRVDPMSKFYFRYFRIYRINNIDQYFESKK